MKNFSFLLFAILLVIAGCARTVESESGAWESNKKRLQELKSLYPGFSAALDKEMARGQSLWDAAAGISNEEQKIAKMAEANAAIGGGWVSDLSGLDADIRKVKSDANSLSGKAVDANDRMAASSTASNVNMVVSRVEGDLRLGSQDPTGSAAIVRRAKDDLRNAQKMITDIENSINAKKDAVKKAETDAKKAEEAEKQNATWNCSYCGKSNDKAATECGGCGAQKN